MVGLRVLVSIVGVVLWCNTSRSLTTAELLKDQLDPRVEYLISTTPHFRIIFHPSLSVVAEHIAMNVETIRSRVLNLCQCRFDDVTSIVVTKRSDTNDVFTSAFPQNQIFLNANLPNFYTGLNDFTDWYLWVLSHEYTHVVHLNQIGARSEYLKTLFGTWYRPNQLRPSWIKEGIAVLFESTLNSKGRLDSTTYKMMSRTAVLENIFDSESFASLATMSNFEDTRWPWNVRPYLMGAEMISNLESTKVSGEQDFWNQLLKSPATYFDAFDSDLAQLSGFSNMSSVLIDTQTKVISRAKKELSDIAKLPISKVEPITRSGNFYFSPLLSADGSTLFYTFDAPDGMSIQSIPIVDNGAILQPKEIVSRSSGSQIALSRSGRFIAFDQVTRQRRFEIVSDIFIYDLKESKIVSISPGMSVQDVDVFPDGKRVVFVRNVEGHHELWSANTNWDDETLLFNDGSLQRISSPRCSPSGKQIVFTQHNDSDGGEDLVLIDDDGRTTKLLSDGFFNSNPSWSTDGRFILFSSDKSGVFNVYQMDIETKVVRRLSNVLGGLIFPVFDKLGKWIYAVHYRANGWEIVRLKLDYTSFKNDTYIAKPKPIVSKVESKPSSSVLAKEVYSASPSYFPDYFYPIATLRPNSAQVGFSGGSTDPLYHHLYEMDLKYDTQSSAPIGKFKWFRALASQSILGEFVSDTSPTYQQSTFRRNDQFRFGTYLPLDTDQNNIHLHAGGIARQVTQAESALYFGGQVGLLYDYEFRPLGELNPTQGEMVDVDLKYLAPQTGTEQQGLFNFDFRLKHHRRFSKGRVFHLQSYGGISFTPDGPNSNYLVGGRQSFPFSIESELILLGYPINSKSTSKALILDLNFQTMFAESKSFFFSSPIYLGSAYYNFCFQTAFIEEEKRFKAVPSLGIEVGKHIIHNSINDLDLRVSFFQGDPAMGGESQIYFAINALR